MKSLFKGRENMKKTFNNKLNRNVYEIFAGDFHSTKEKNVVLTTLLGSCISACIKCKETGVVGINHFMLPSSIKIEEMIFNEDARYGIHAMELMINSMMKLGAKRNSMVAKVFGGGKVLDTTLSNVSKSNIEFVLAYLNMEEIPIIAKDVGGNYGRKIYLFPDTFTIYMKKINHDSSLDTAIARERKFFEWMQNQRRSEGYMELFNEGGKYQK